jgi:hypothetical protein
LIDIIAKTFKTTKFSNDFISDLKKVVNDAIKLKTEIEENPNDSNLKNIRNLLNLINKTDQKTKKEKEEVGDLAKCIKILRSNPSEIDPIYIEAKKIIDKKTALSSGLEYGGDLPRRTVKSPTHINIIPKEANIRST